MPQLADSSPTHPAVPAARGGAPTAKRPFVPAEDFRTVLASVDRRGRRNWVYATIVPGRWRRYRTAVSLALIGFYLALPFARIGGSPALRIDIAARRLSLLGAVFDPTDLAALALLALIAVLGTILAVALYGRLFCGWVCPHNVFLETVFRRIETWCEGSAPARKRRDAQPMHAEKLGRKAAKWMLYALCCGAIANAFTATFVGTEAFLGGVLIDPTRHPTAAGVFAALFALTLFNFAWFREQTCTIVCPYGRLQSALTDRDSVVVSYDRARGEPRGRKGTDGAGDCVDCRLCVQSCPTGIDIRDGNQLECLHCTACIDACDSVMLKLGRKPGLVRYASDNQLAGQPRRLARPRTALTAIAFAAAVGGLLALVGGHRDVDVLRLRDTAMPMLDHAMDGTEVVRELVNLSLRNRAGEPRTVRFAIRDPRTRVIAQFPTVTIAAHQRVEHSLLVEAPRAAGRIDTVIEASDEREVVASIPVRVEAR